MTSSTNAAQDNHNCSENLIAISCLYSSLTGFTRSRWGGSDHGRYFRTQPGALAGLLGNGGPATLVADRAAIYLWLRCLRRGALLAGAVSFGGSHLGRAAEGARTLRPDQRGDRSPGSFAKHDPADSEPHATPEAHRAVQSVSRSAAAYEY